MEGLKNGLGTQMRSQSFLICAIGAVTESALGVTKTYKHLEIMPGASLSSKLVFFDCHLCVIHNTCVYKGQRKTVVPSLSLSTLFP